MKTLGLALFFVVSAFAQKTEIESDQAVDFTKFKTFAIRGGRLNSKNPSLNSELIQKRIDADIQKTLEAKGLTFVESGAADLNVRYTLGSARKMEIIPVVVTSVAAETNPRVAEYARRHSIVILRAADIDRIIDWVSTGRDFRELLTHMEEIQNDQRFRRL